MAMAAAPAAPLVGPRYRIRIRAYGIVRLDSAKLSGTGFEAQPLSTYKLTERGVEIPLLVFDGNGNDQLDAGDSVEFYGQPLDDEPKTVLNTEFPGGASIYEARDFTDENIYFLTTEAGARSRLATRSAPPDLSAPAAKFDAIARPTTPSVPSARPTRGTRSRRNRTRRSQGRSRAGRNRSRSPGSPRRPIRCACSCACAA
jgi:hypothetical protein